MRPRFRGNDWKETATPLRVVHRRGMASPNEEE